MKKGMQKEAFRTELEWIIQIFVVFVPISVTLT